jgi:hypothetical protein
MAQRATQRWSSSRQTATGSGAPAGQSGARQRTAAQLFDQAAARSSAFLRLVTRGQSSAAQQPLASTTGSGLYVVTAQSSSVAHSMASGPGGFRSGGGDSFAVGVGVGVGVGWSEWEEHATASTSRATRRMARGWH